MSLSNERSSDATPATETLRGAPAHPASGIAASHFSVAAVPSPALPPPARATAAGSRVDPVARCGGQEGVGAPAASQPVAVSFCAAPLGPPTVAVPSHSAASSVAGAAASAADPAASPGPGAVPAAPLPCAADCEATSPAASATAFACDRAAAVSCAPTKGDCCCSLLDFLLLVGQLKYLKRTGWLRSGIQRHRVETVAEHSFRAAICAMLIGSDKQSAELIAEGKLDRNKCVKMALVHDLAEALVGDITPCCPVTPTEKRRRESEAIKQMCALLPTAGAIPPDAARRCPQCVSSSSLTASHSSSSGEDAGNRVQACTSSSSSSAATDSGDNNNRSGTQVTSGGAGGEACCRSSERDSSRACRSGSSNTLDNTGVTGGSTDTTSDSSSSRRDVKGTAAEILSLWEEYEAGETAEAKFVFDIDKFEMILQAYEYEAEAYRNPTLLVNGNKRLHAHEHQPLHPTETILAQDVKRLCVVSRSQPHLQDLRKRVDIQQQQQATVGQQHSVPQQHQQAVKEGPSEPQSQQREQQDVTAQQPHLQSQELAEVQQQQRQRQLGQAEELHRLSPHQQRLEQLSSMQHVESEATGEMQQGLRLSSFFKTTKGVFKSALFQMLDALLRERRRQLHCMHAPQPDSSTSASGSRKSSGCALPV